MTRWVPALVLMGLFLAFEGYSAGRGDQSNVLAHYLAQHDAAAYARDWHVQAYRAVSPHRPWFAFLGLLDRAVGLEGALLLAWAGSFLLLCLAGTVLSQALFPRAPPWAHWLAVLLLLAVPPGNLASNWLMEPELKPRLPAYGLALLALALLLRAPLSPRRAAAAGALMALVTQVHVGIGLLAGGALAAAMALWWQGGAVRPRAALAFLAVDAVGLLLRLPYLLGTRPRLGVAGAEVDLISVYLQMRAPHHFAPGTWPLEDWVGFGACVGLGALALPLLDRERRRQVLILAAVLGTLLLAALFFAVVVPVYSVMLLQIWRLATLARALALVLGAGLIARLLRSRPGRGLFLLGALATPWGLAWGVLAAAAGRRRRRVFLSVAGAALVALWLASGAMAPLVPVFGVGLALSSRRPLPVLAAAAACAFAAATSRTASVLPLAGLALGLAGSRRPFLPLALAACGAAAATSWWAGLLLLACLLPWPALRVGPALLAVLLVAAWWGPAQWAGDRQGLDRWSFRMVPLSDTERLAHWCRENTPTDAVFLTPPDLAGFRFWARRAVVVDYATPPISGPELLEWARRLGDVLGHPGPPSRLVDLMAGNPGALALHGDLPAEALAALGRRYGADYVVSTRTLGLRLVRREGHLRLYRLPGSPHGS